ncbi:MAG: thiamine phosphate synthase [Sandaracinaceae bacterium]
MRGGLYAILDPAATRGRDPLEVASAVLEGGCSRLQLRMKSGTDPERLALARRLRAACRFHEVPFVLNDRADLACLVGADALHLGQDDLPIAEARRIVGAMEIGRSTHSVAQANEAVAQGADVVAIGPVFATNSKADADPVVGLEMLREVSRLPIPVVAIGGITGDNAAAIREAGATWGAVISALCADANPKARARALHGVLSHDARVDAARAHGVLGGEA